MNRSAIKEINKPCNKCDELLKRDNSADNRKCWRSCNYKQIHKKEFVYWQPQPQISKPERSLIIGSSGSGKTHLMLSISKNLNPKNIYIISKLEDQYPSK